MWLTGSYDRQSWFPLSWHAKSLMYALVYIMVLVFPYVCIIHVRAWVRTYAGWMAEWVGISGWRSDGLRMGFRGWMDGRTDGRRNGQKKGWTGKGWMGWWMMRDCVWDGWMDRRAKERSSRWGNGWILRGWEGGWMDGRTDGRNDGWGNVWVDGGRE